MRIARGIALVLALIAGIAAPAAAQPDPWTKAARKPGLVQTISPKLNEEAWFVPGAGDAILKARVFLPAGPGPFKVAIINHGSPSNAASRPNMHVPAYRAAAEWLVARGYMVVLPLRRGYGEPEGSPWPEKYGTCDNPNYTAAGKAAADDIEAVVRYVRTMPMVRKDRVLLIGHSAGGFGAGARTPSLWLYAENDSYIGPVLSRRLAEAYRSGGGNVDYRLLPAFKNEGHDMFGSADGRTLWTGPVEEFLKKLE